ncbi:hypothetical protein RB620_05210 [Paenibacillus sp. LHD-117]|uniref:hypothetical protein n=1 Tax=Paenibacillus sp. LHD-117 TaxID=3071412 RepID=UPI0027E19E1A|nr:hypothetical protein [Paenibacillus sp. LHD-117]MDQ6418834.1 hypothetical protein [Paenibacillus sp. LHD-117]
MNMKKISSIIALSLLAGIICFVGYNQLNPQILVATADYPTVPFEELEEQSHVIVKAQLVDNLADEVKFDKSKVPLDWRTFTSLKIIEIYKDVNGEFNEGDTVTVMEPFASWRDARGAYEIHREHYLPIQKEKEYIFYLYKSNTFDAYEIHSHHQGKYILNTTGKDISVLKKEELEVTDIETQYLENYKKVMAKYHNGK